MAANKAILRAAGVLVVLVLGIFIGASFRGSLNSGDASPEVSGDSGAAALEVLRAENVRLKAELARRTERPSGTSVEAARTAPLSAVEQLRVLADLSKRRLLNPGISTFSFRDARTLSAAFVELFALTPAEATALQAAVDLTRDRLAELERENSTVRRVANGEVSITIHPFARAGGAVYDELMGAFSSTLGPDRQAAFLTLAAEGIERSLGGIGTVERTIVFSRKDAPGSDRPFAANESQGVTGGVARRSADFKTFEDMAAWAGTSVRLIPSDFPRGK